MTRRKQFAITPIWAQNIEVREQGEALLVKGWGHLALHVDAQNVSPEHCSTLDILEQFRHYALRSLHKEPVASDAGIYQFADATTDGKLLAFVNKFGPVWGQVQKLESDSLFETQTITVLQDLALLRREQERFAAAVQLLGQLNRNGRADLKAIVAAMMTIAPAPRLYLPSRMPPAIAKLAISASPGTTVSEKQPWIWSLLAVNELVRGKPPGVAERITECGHRALCNLFNGFPPMLIPVRGRQLIELPRIASEGILHALYFKLRLDYLAQRAIGTCQNCGGHFVVSKRGARACGEVCRRALRNRKYWKSHNKTINRKRRISARKGAK